MTIRPDIVNVGPQSRAIIQAPALGRPTFEFDQIANRINRNLASGVQYYVRVEGKMPEVSLESEKGFGLKGTIFTSLYSV